MDNLILEAMICQDEHWVGRSALVLSLDHNHELSLLT